MSLAEPIPPALVAAERLSREGFLSRWVALPQLQFAELIEGVIYVLNQSLRSLEHRQFVKALKVRR